jgi:hypothetical protein
MNVGSVSSLESSVDRIGRGGIPLGRRRDGARAVAPTQ